MSKILSSLAAKLKPAPIQLAGTAPVLDRHLLLRTRQPASTWPSHFGSTSAIHAELEKRWQKNPGLSRIGFNFIDSPTSQQLSQPTWKPDRPRFETPDASAEQETYSAVLYPEGIEIDDVSLSTLDSVEKGLTDPSLLTGRAAKRKKVDIFVCTHTARDCRCGDLGEPLYQSLVSWAKRKGIGGRMGEDEGLIQVARIGHVGGHKWAANALVYTHGEGTVPSGDWYGLLREEDAQELLERVMESSDTPWWKHWRGRLGTSAEDAKAIHEEALASKDGDGKVPKKARKQKDRVPLGDPVQIVFRRWHLPDIELTGYVGESVMETARRHNLDGILATCGGFCECATCHVHLSSLVGAPVPFIAPEEEDMLDYAIGSDERSRLSCQIPVTKELGMWCAQGCRIEIPKY